MSQTRLDFNGASGKFASLQSGRSATETAPVVPSGPLYAFSLAATVATAVGFTGAVTSGGAHLLEGTVADGGTFSNIFHVSKRTGGLYLISAGSAVTGGTASGSWTTTSLSTAGVLTLTRSLTTEADTLSATIRKL
jgi:hypothetical protein